MRFSLSDDAPRRVRRSPTTTTTVRQDAGTRASAGDAAETRDDAERLPPLLRMRTSEAVWYVGWPTTVIGLLRSVFPITDTFWVGKLGTVELTALCSNSARDGCCTWCPPSWRTGCRTR